MFERQKTITNQRIIHCLLSNYGIEVVALTCLPLGADRDASIYRAQAADKRSYFVKVKQGRHHSVSVAITRLLCEAGIQQVIPPIQTTSGQPLQYIDDSTLIVYPFIDGSNGFSNNLTDEQWVILGKALKEIHEIEVPPAIESQLRREAYSPKWREIVKQLFSHIETIQFDDEMAVKLMKFMKENAHESFRLVDRAQELGQKLQNLPTKFVLCHSDIHGGNVLINGNNQLYIVDWDEPMMAPKERDLMFIGGGVANVWNKPQEEELFYKGYGVTDVNVDILAYYRQERIVEDMAIYGQELFFGTAEAADRQEMFKEFTDMFEPNGVVDIALKTDKENK